MKYPLFSKDDLTAFWALFSDNLANIVISTGVCLSVFGMSGKIVFGRILPGVSVSLIVGLFFYANLARKLALKEGRTDVTALPYGISTPVMFVYLFGIVGPVYFSLKAKGIENASLYAWQIGVASAFIGGVIEAIGSIFGPYLKKITPRAGMLGTLAGIAIVWIATVPMAEIFEDPVVGFVSLAIVFTGLIARVRFPANIPAGLLAIIVATVISLFMGHSKITFENVSFHLPVPVFSDLINGFKLLFKYPSIFTIIIPIEIYNFIETMNNVESAQAAGDKYPVGTCQIMDGAGTMVGSIFGSMFPTTVYIGHPAYKRLNARSGYALGVGIVIFFSAIFGLIQFLYHLIPIAAVAPMLVFVGIVITGQAFTATPHRHSLAVAVALIPHVSNLLVSKINSVLQTAGTLVNDRFIAKLLEAGVHWQGQNALSQGAILTGLLWGAIVAELTDLKFKKAFAFSLMCFFLALFGFIHSPKLEINFSSIAIGYLIMSVFFLLAHLINLNNKVTK